METVSVWDFFSRFYLLSPPAGEALGTLHRTISLKKGGILQPPGHHCNNIYFIESGVSRIFYDKDGTDITEDFEFQGALVVRAESLFTGNPSKKGIQALTACTFAAFPAGSVFALYDTHPEIERLFRLLFEAAYVKSIQRIESLQFHDARERYEALLQAQPELLQVVPLKHIASYLGITQVSLSRIRALR